MTLLFFFSSPNITSLVQNWIL